MFTFILKPTMTSMSHLNSAPLSHTATNIPLNMRLDPDSPDTLVTATLSGQLVMRDGRTRLQ